VFIIDRHYRKYALYFFARKEIILTGRRISYFFKKTGGSDKGGVSAQIKHHPAKRDRLLQA
jgi:hypothetical protein